MSDGSGAIGETIKFFLDGEEVDEVTRFGPSEQCEHLVDRELLAAQCRCGLSTFCGEQPGVCGKVDLGSIVSTFNEEPREAGAHLHSANREPGCLQRAFHGREESIDSIGR